LFSLTVDLSLHIILQSQSLMQYLVRKIGPVGPIFIY
jgi:hypothetical protein